MARIRNRLTVRMDPVSRFYVQHYTEGFVDFVRVQVWRVVFVWYLDR